MASNLGERNNLASARPDRVQAIRAVYETIVAAGSGTRTAPTAMPAPGVIG